ncbi:MAG TPA: T9SS type A sorting domain-containing protein, partial [Rhodothermales bacterium]|nr:T9SS type A sorting domain-containing protein [Rhodothermales bacterium]
EVQAQVVYHDVDPDEFIIDGAFFIDFDGDGDAELELNEDDEDDGLPRDYARAYRATESPTAPDSVTGIIADLVPFPGAGLYAYPLPLNAGAAINAGADFEDYYTFTFTFEGDDPVDWRGTGEHYIGVRLSLTNGPTTTTHFGWVLIEIPSQGGSMLLKSYAYEATPNTPIAAGNTGVSIAPGPDGSPGTHALSEAYPNPSNGASRFTLEVAETQDVRVAVYDLVGREVAVLHDGTLAQGRDHVFTLDASALPDGVYVVRTVGTAFSDARRVTLAH